MNIIKKGDTMRRVFSIVYIALLILGTLELVFATNDQDRIRAALEVMTGDDMFKISEAIKELISIGSPAVPVLIENLDHKARDVRAGCVEALGKIKDKRAYQPLVDMLHKLGPHPKYAETFADEYIRIMTIKALGDLGVPDAIGELGKVLDSPNEYDRTWALVSMVKLGNDEAYQKLLDQLKSSNQDIRNIVCQQLGELGRIDAVPYLIKMLSDEKWFVRDSAVISLGKLGDPSALEALQGMLEDKNAFVKRSAQKAIDRIKRARQ